LSNEKFTYKSQAEVEIDNLLKGAEGQNEISKDLLEIKNELKGLYNKELEIYKPEILREIKAELAARYLGADGRVLEQLDSDDQVQAALKILNDQKDYNHLLQVN
jgi:2-hydroxychromene-2-carboxylate isomerase